MRGALVPRLRLSDHWNLTGLLAYGDTPRSDQPPEYFLPADALLPHLSLLFVPVGLGVITHLDLVRQYGWQLLLVLIASAWTGLVVTALALRLLLRRSAGATPPQPS